LVEPRVGRTFGRVAEEYERARPEYSREAVGSAARRLGLTSSSTVLDLAAGTGKLTRALAERFAHVIAVEPDDAMRACIDGDARAGTAEAIPLDDMSVDAVFVGEAFHWFDAPLAVGEIRRVLRAGGGVALVGRDWFDSETPRISDDARALLDEVWARFHGDTRFTGDGGKQHIEAEFGPLRHESFVTHLPYSGDLLADLCITASTPAALEDDERAVLRHELRAQLEDDYVLQVTTTLDWARS
jgi:SAM-dependent methyltransferase